MKTKSLWITIFLTGVLSVGWIAPQEGKWDEYYKIKMSQPPRPLIVDALGLFQNQGKAIDLGCGAGNETLLLLNHGWQVWAIDGEPNSIHLVRSRIDLENQERLTTIVAKYEEVDWDILPEVDFFAASYALPFCHPLEFENFWTHIKAKILPDGRFAGHFFGLNYQGFDAEEMEGMTFLTREEVLELFEGFTIEYFEESEEDRHHVTGPAVHAHVFDVIARKITVLN